MSVHQLLSNFNSFSLSIRPFYVFEKTVAFLGTFTLLYTITEHYIIPLTPRFDQSFFRSLLDLALPFMVSQLKILTAHMLTRPSLSSAVLSATFLYYIRMHMQWIR